MLCVTHDVSETLAFDRVLVIDSGTIVEDGIPVELAGNPSSRYAEMLESEKLVQEKTWADRAWRGVRIEDGILTTSASGEHA